MSAHQRSRVGGWPIAIAVGIAAILLYAVRYALLPFIIAAVIGFVAQPAIDRGARLAGGRRWPAAVLLYLVILVCLGGGGYAVGRRLAVELPRVLQRLPQMTHNLMTVLVGQNGITMFGKTLTPDVLTRSATEMAAQLIGPPQIATIAAIAIAAILAGFLLLVLIPYFLISGPHLARGAVRLLPPERRSSVDGALQRLAPVVRRYLLGVIGVIVYTAVVAWIGFGLVFHLSGAVLLAVVVGVLEIIPAVGPATSMAIVGLTAIQQSSVTAAIVLMAFAVALRLSIDNVVGPIVLGRAVRVHPVVVMFSFVCGAMLFGIVGLLLAVPTAACLKLVLQHYYAEPIAPGGDAEPETVQISPQSRPPVSGTGPSAPY